ncbi:MAG: class I SAM-dependent methyltransferase [Candidatus Omnitrophica bacterium]|nr:class I SAM-dependent methyltransferase [Candidatus Omnitrophota bacterium]
MHKELAKLQSVVDKLVRDIASDGRTIRVLDAGCGSFRYVDLKQNVYTVGIDVSEKQLQKNANLNEKILGDLQTYDLPASSFDLIICWDVLEHLPNPTKALLNFKNATKKGGIVILKLPNILSIKGLLTKFTPLGFHVWMYRHVCGSQEAGKDGHGPFRTFFKFSIRPAAVKRFALENGFSIEYLSIYEGHVQNKVIDTILAILKFILQIFTLGKINPNKTDYIMVLKKQKR